MMKAWNRLFLSLVVYDVSLFSGFSTSFFGKQKHDVILIHLFSWWFEVDTHCKTCSLGILQIPQMFHVWIICLHKVENGYIQGENVGKDSHPMDHVGSEIFLILF